MPTCFDVADYFLAWQDEEAGDYISNLKLQKLCYYAQGFTLAITNKPLFSESIEAWQHGPVCPDLYQAFKKYSSSPIPIPTRELCDIVACFSQEQREVLDEVRILYGQFSAWKLRDLTYEERPWKETYSSTASTLREIPQILMKEYFKTQLVS